MIIPTYLEYMKTKKSDFPCLNCLIDTEERINYNDFENRGAGDKLWYANYAKESRELRRILQIYKPKKILEIGTGNGRVIQTALEVLPDSRIIAVEKNEKMFNYSRHRFFGDKRVSVVKQNISYFLSKTKKFDMALCMMNTFGNINDSVIFQSMANQVKFFVFSVYNRKFDKKRKIMYEARGHEDFCLIKNQYCFRDYWINGLVSRSYTREEIIELAHKSSMDILELKPLNLLYFVVLKRKK